MNNPEKVTPESQSICYEDQLLVNEIIGLAAEVVIDEDVESSRNDVFDITWDELQTTQTAKLELSQQVLHQMASTDLYGLYMQALRRLYPQLADVSSADELAYEMALIEDLPRCDGSWTMSSFVAEDGTERAITYVQVNLGEYGCVLSADVMDNDIFDPRMYHVALVLDQWMAVGVYGKTDLEPREEAMLDKVHPTQANSLRRLLIGATRPEDIDAALTSIRVHSEQLISEQELDEIINYARDKHTFAALTSGLETKTRGYTSQDLEQMMAIILERAQQL